MSCAGILATILCGCASRGPALVKYEPTRFSNENAAAQWGMQAWNAAQEGDRLALINTLEHPPNGLATEVPTLIQMFLDIQQDVDAEDDLLAKESLETLSQQAPFQEEWVGAAGRLAELYSSRHSQSTLMESIEPDLRALLIDSVQFAEEAESSGDYQRAFAAWQVASSLSNALGDSGTWVNASEKGRAASQPLAWNAQREDRLSKLIPGGIRKFTPAAYVQIVKVIVERHVNNLDWRDLVVSGFDRLMIRADDRLWRDAGSEQPVATLDEKQNLESFLSSIEEIRERFLADSASIDCPSRTLCTKAATLTRRALYDIKLEVQRTGAVDFRDLGESFVQGALLRTDMRTRMIWADDVPALRRQLGEGYVGIGAQVSMDDTGYPKLEPMSGSPAKQAGVRSGDLLISVDGISTRNKPLDDAVGKVIGFRGSTVALTLQRVEEPDDFTVHVRRNMVYRPTIVGWNQAGVDTSGKPRWNWLVNRPLGIAYIRIDAFTPDTEREFRTAMDQAHRTLGPDRQIEGLVIDLRGNTGGTKNAATRLIDLFLDNGSICATQDSSGNTRLERANWARTRLEGMPLVLLMNETSASASELLAGTLQGSADAVVIGEQSYGKGSAQSLLEYQGGIVIVTTAWFGVPTEEASIRFIDRSRAPDDWGIIPQLEVATSSRHDNEIITERDTWHSYLGLDVPDDGKGNKNTSMLKSRDRVMLLAMALLQARVLPAALERND